MAIIRLDSEQFFKDFLPNEDTSKFSFIPISEMITTEGKRTNIMAIQKLIPPPNVTCEFINNGFSDKYKESYISYLLEPEQQGLIASIVRGGLELNLVLICSKQENEYKYLKLLCGLIENEFKMKTYSYKKYLKNRDKANKVKNKEDIERVIYNRLSTLSKSNCTFNQNMSISEMVEYLDQMSKKDLITYCKNKGVKGIDKDMKRKEIKMLLIDKLSKDNIR